MVRERSSPFRPLFEPRRQTLREALVLTVLALIVALMAVTVTSVQVIGRLETFQSIPTEEDH